MRINFLGLMRFTARVRARIFTAAVRGGFHSFGKNSVLIGPARLAGTQHIHVGSSVTIGAHSWLQVIQPTEARCGPAIVIGDGVSMAGYCTISSKLSVTIGPKVLIARYVYISDHSHEFRSRSRPIIDQGVSNIAPVKVCEGAWLGQNVVVCPGVTIGRNAVVGANSVVRQDIPDFCVAAGAPARIIRHVDAPFVAGDQPSLSAG